ncbi:MAG: LysM peptidoglycan-binding domain-containing protein [Deltaproteobacteria bacterium]|nr:LysM peptidoglycan-binding domain-containing protein [Deltaproteobacteria bacterium]
MRAALLTTAVVLLVFVAWANLRGSLGSERRPDLATSQSSGELPDVAAPPTRAAEIASPSPEAVYEPATGAPPARQHVVAAGETLATISLRHYGDETHANAIYEANRDQIRDPAQLHEGQTLSLP